MECDVAVLGGGPGGYTAAIRAAQLGAKTVCIEKEPELGGTCLRVGCIPTKAWVQTAFFLKEAEESFAKLGVKVERAAARLRDGERVEGRRRQADDRGVATLFKANGVEWVKGTGRFKDANTIAVEGGEDVTFKSAIVATGSFPMRPPIEGLDSELCVDSTGLLAQNEVPRAARRPRRRHHRLRVRLDLQAFRLRGDDHRDAAAPDPAGGRGRGQGARQAVRQARDHAPAGEAVHEGRGRRRRLTVHFGEGETVEADLMLVSVGRGPLVEGLGLEDIGVEFDRRKGIAADEHRRTTVPHIYAVGDCAGYWQLAHTAFREGEVAAENAMGHDAVVDNRGVPRPIYTDPEIAGVGLTEAEAREQYGDDVAVGRFPWVANARAVMQDETVGWVKSIHETRYGELLGLVMVGPHVTDLVEAGVVALDAEATVETVADGMAPHPTLSEAIKEAGLVALGRPIHLPPKRRRRRRPNERRHDEDPE